MSTSDAPPCKALTTSLWLLRSDHAVFVADHGLAVAVAEINGGAHAVEAAVLLVDGDDEVEEFLARLVVDGVVDQAFEPPRISRRLRDLRGWSHLRFSAEVRERAVRLVLEQQSEHESEWAAICSIAGKMSCAPETLRNWVRQAERDAGTRSGPTTGEGERLKQLERENRELRRANDIANGCEKFAEKAFLHGPSKSIDLL